MQSAENDSENSTGATFWEPKQYMRTVKRAETGNKLCSELCCLLQERAEIERAYSSHLKKWSLRLNQLKETEMEYGTCSNFLSGLSKEADENSELHFAIAASLNDPVQSEIKLWQKDNFHKSSISNSIKEVKALETSFERVQKTWHKLYKTVQRCKKEYFLACKAVRTQQVQVQNAKNDPVGTPEQQSILRKVEEKLKKTVREEEVTREAYKSALNLLADQTPPYIDDMTKVFAKAQQAEKSRIEFFKQQAFQILDVLDISKKPALPQIYVTLMKTFETIDADADLKQFSFSHGVDMPTCFPTFEEYSPELNSLNKKRGHPYDAHSSVTLTGVSAIGSPHPVTNKSSDSNPSSQDNTSLIVNESNNPDSTIPINKTAVTASKPMELATNPTPEQSAPLMPPFIETSTEIPPIALAEPPIDSVVAMAAVTELPLSPTPRSEQNSRQDSPVMNLSEDYLSSEAVKLQTPDSSKTLSEQNSIQASPAVNLDEEHEETIEKNEPVMATKAYERPPEVSPLRRNPSSVCSTENPFAETVEE